ncbi:hypothetical protein MmiHf6_13740 [Methanimicrococcus hongohii]|uniref:PGF-CTERM archaeal protein-sorting signal domain-containing protein n=1 Tax=Methanimicrococcus hongohii TaxID=3028295 RepID=A0AA96ZT07_9EURY|nr:PGF-CTERM sorting domain-containing protein [Methanimicrococcus sp. Hf6]WNY24049.1 hypothetical protein MmiHf6_13740 [Methanimicrococcus sp. Hf6]
MNKNMIKLTAVAVIFLLLATPAYGTLTRDEAVQSVLPYSRNHGSLSMAGPYTYQDNAYYYAEMTTNGTLSGVLIVNGETGDVITDESIARKISFTHLYLTNVTQMNLAGYKTMKETYTASAAVCRQKAEIFNQEIPLYNSADRQKLGTIVQSYQNTAVVFDDLATLFDKIIATQEDVISGNASYENAVILENQTDEFEKLLEKLDKAYDKTIEDTNTYYDILIDGASTYGLNASQISDYKIIGNSAFNQEREVLITMQLQLIEEDRVNTNTRVETDIVLMNNLLSKSEVPGFGILAAVCALIGIVLYGRRK